MNKKEVLTKIRNAQSKVELEAILGSISDHVKRSLAGHIARKSEKLKKDKK
jgi:hypothetical protein